MVRQLLREHNDVLQRELRRARRSARQLQTDPYFGDRPARVQAPRVGGYPSERARLFKRTRRPLTTDDMKRILLLRYNSLRRFHVIHMRHRGIAE